MKVVKVTSKGQVTIPIEIRTALAIDKDTYLEVVEADSEVRLRKIVSTEPLGARDPIWTLIGAGESGQTDTAAHHDRHLADAEVARWRKPS